MNNIIIMYHYVRNNSKFYAFTTTEFHEQIRYLKKKYRIITLNEFLLKKPKDHTCVLTFDDGIKDGITNILPILKEEKIKATFFIPTKILVERKLLSVQKRHILLAHLGTNRFVNEFNEICRPIFKIYEENESNPRDDKLTSNLKYMLDTMDYELSNKYLDIIFNKYFDEEKEFDKIYLSEKNINTLIKEGMDIGLHSHSHRWLARLYFNDMEKEINTSAKIFEKKLNFKPKTMSYPMGSYNFLVKRVARKIGLVGACTTNEKNNIDLNTPLELGRYDCITLPPRKNKFNL